MEERELRRTGSWAVMADVGEALPSDLQRSEPPAMTTDRCGCGVINHYFSGARDPMCGECNRPLTR